MYNYSPKADRLTYLAVSNNNNRTYDTIRNDNDYFGCFIAVNAAVQYPVVVHYVQLLIELLLSSLACSCRGGHCEPTVCYCWRPDWTSRPETYRFSDDTFYSLPNHPITHKPTDFSNNNTMVMSAMTLWSQWRRALFYEQTRAGFTITRYCNNLQSLTTVTTP